jgi:phosphonate transport system permease protein
MSVDDKATPWSGAKARGHTKPRGTARAANRRVLWLLVAAAAILWSVWQADLAGRDLVNEGGWELVRRFITAAAHPALAPDFLALALDAALTTLAYAACATFLFVITASVGGVLASQSWWEALFRAGRGGLLRGKAPWVAVRAALAPLRAVHEVIWGLFFINVLGLDPLTAILAIAIPYSAIGAKVFSEILDETPHAPLDALLNGGAPPLAALLYGLIPEALPNLLSYTFYRFECGIRAAAVLGLIGAGGLGYQILLSMQTLNYEEMWTLIAALVILSGLSDLWSSAVRRRLEGAFRREVRRVKPGGRRAGRADRVIGLSVVGAAVLTVFSFWYLRPGFARLIAPDTLDRLGYILGEAFPPRLGSTSLAGMLALSARTFAISVLAMTFAGLLGIVFSFLGARNFALREGRGRRSAWGLPLLAGSRFLLLVGRAVPPPLWALLFLFVLFPGVLPAAIALGLYNWGVAGRLMAEAVENMDERPLDALRASGAPPAATFLYGALPVTLPSAVAYTLYRWEVCIRATVIVGIVGAGGLGRLISEQLARFDYDGVAASLLFLVALTFLVDLISAAARRSLRAGGAPHAESRAAAGWRLAPDVFQG